MKLLENVWAILVRIWKFFDGAKTALGWLFSMLVSAPFIPSSWDETLIWLATFFGGVGVADKIRKGEIRFKRKGEIRFKRRIEEKE